MKPRVRVTARYKPNNEEFGKFMVSEQARRPAVEAARDMVETLRVTVRRSSGSGPHLADSYKVDDQTPPRLFAGNVRVGATVYSEHPAAAPEEFGGKRNQAKHWLANVAAAWHTPKKKRGRK